MLRGVVVWGWVVVGLLALPTGAAAQSFGSFGFGPRFAFVRGDLGLDTPATTFFGGTMRYRITRQISFEFAADYRKYRGRLARFREVPMQASALVSIPPSFAMVRPYVVAGAGLYRRATDIFDANGLLFATTTEYQSGWHLGGGAEFSVLRHTTAFVDVRFRSVHFGGFPEGSTFSGLADIKLSRGAMMTSGVAFYF
jgi:opacity protein-like surface antigen